MFAARYFGARHFGARYFGHRGLSAPAVRGTYIGTRYFGRRYWNQKSTQVDGAYCGGNYFGHHYFAKSYFGVNDRSEPFSIEVTAGPYASCTCTFGSVGFAYGADRQIAQTNILQANATGLFSGNLRYENEDFSLTPPLDITGGVGSSAFACNFTVTVPEGAGTGRYFGPRYYGSRYFGATYWGTLHHFNLEVSNTLAVSASTTLSASPTLAVSLTFSQMQMLGVGLMAADISTAEPSRKVIGAPGGGTARIPRYMVIVNGEKHFGTREEIERLIEQIAEDRAEKPNPKRKPKIAVKAEKPQDGGPIPQDVKHEAELVQAQMRDMYAEVYRRALAASQQQIDEEDDLIGIL